MGFELSLKDKDKELGRTVRIVSIVYPPPKKKVCCLGFSRREYNTREIFNAFEATA